MEYTLVVMSKRGKAGLDNLLGRGRLVLDNLPEKERLGLDNLPGRKIAAG